MKEETICGIILEWDDVKTDYEKIVDALLKCAIENDFDIFIQDF